MQIASAKPKVLYVDDEEDNLLVFSSSMRRFYDVETANSAYTAMDILRDREFDVIISDQRMPKVNGVEFLNNLPDETRSLRMILTGYSDVDIVIKALNNGRIDKYISKPWKKDELQQIIDDALINYKEKQGRLEMLNHKSPTKEQERSRVENISYQNISDKEIIEQLKQKEAENIALQKQVDDAYKNVQLLSEIGQEITSTLNLDDILNTVYENVNHLMDASVFGIGTYNAEGQTIDYHLAIEKGKRFKPYSRSMEDKNQFPVWCVENKKEIFINDVEKESQIYIKETVKINAEHATMEDGSKSDIPYSIIYMPLLVKENVIGLITVQSFNKSAYSNYHLNNLRNIAIYVATALENAKAYKLIEEHKTEIEQKNVELEQKVQQRTEELRQQKDELEDTFSKLKLLTEIGQEITSTLHLDTILNTVYENVNNLMDASVFGIGIYNSDKELIEYRLAIEKGKRYQPYTRSMEDKNQFPVWCIENKKEVFINDVKKDAQNYLKENVKVILGSETLEDGSKAEAPLSLIYIPLLFNNKPTGVLTVQSFRKHAYNQYHLDILRSLASYITTAIQNAGSYSKMTEAFEQLKSAQSKLVESEKMASLGVLTAGVAHEINNPVTFISGGIESLEDNYTDIENLLKEIKNVENIEEAKAQWEKIEKIKTEIDLDRILSEMKDLFQSVKNGANRTSEIVKGLRNFSRLDENDMKKANLEEGLNNTLVILNNKFKNRIELIKEYGKIPEIECYPGQLNQVFMNILSNACDAIENEGEITVQTRVENEKVFITIRDNGSGMPDDVRAHIFEPFFTTKAVGKGTGLGLSISYGIIEKHKGTIHVSSEPGKGTEFIIILPTQM
ncbi:MAG: ATP-binding protein [Bacteroidota bacterium]|nr:ATP-binding protein [Bacteroidota bacterium]